MRNKLPIEFPPRMTREQAAQYLGLSVATLAQDRQTHRHRFPLIEVGRRCVYDKTQLDMWLAAHSINSPEPASA